MAAEIQFRGGTAVNQDAFTGLSREISIDTDNMDLRVHDGVTQGGILIINRDNGDERWQAKSVELDGFSFAPEKRGQVTRLGTGNYRIRQWTWNTAQMTITNPDGYNGNPYLTLNTRIETQHIFGDDVTFEGILTASGGVVGNLTGNVTGNLTGDVTGDVTGNLTGNANGNHTGSFAGDVDVTGQTLLLDDGQIAPSKIAGLQAFVVANALPSGVIMMWSGTVETIPSGWFLCNGLNGTPDLTDKFIVGAGGVTYDPADEAGSVSHTHANTLDAAADHTHVATIAAHALTEAQLPTHRHSTGVAAHKTSPSLFPNGSTAASSTTPDSIDHNGNDGIYEGWSSEVGSGEGHTHSASLAVGGAHNHGLNNASASSLPPYFALCFIMRVVS